MAVIHVHGAELMIYSRIETQLAPLGHSVLRARPGLDGGAPDVCICDVERVEPVSAVADLRPAKLLGFGSHEQPEALRPLGEPASTASSRARRSPRSARRWSTT